MTTLVEHEHPVAPGMLPVRRNHQTTKPPNHQTTKPPCRTLLLHSSITTTTTTTEPPGIEYAACNCTQYHSLKPSCFPARAPSSAAPTASAAVLSMASSNSSPSSSLQASVHNPQALAGPNYSLSSQGTRPNSRASGSSNSQCSHSLLATRANSNRLSSSLSSLHSSRPSRLDSRACHHLLSLSGHSLRE